MLGGSNMSIIWRVCTLVCWYYGFLSHALQTSKPTIKGPYTEALLLQRLDQQAGAIPAPEFLDLSASTTTSIPDGPRTTAPPLYIDKNQPYGNNLNWKPENNPQLYQRDQAQWRQDRALSHLMFPGWDCGMPQQIMDMGYKPTNECVDPIPRHFENSRNVTYQILQREEQLGFKGYKCTATKTKIVRYCGAYDHQTVHSAASYYDVPFEVDSATCNSGSERGEFKGPHGELYKVSKAGVTFIKYEEVGHTYPYGSEIKCQGQDWYYKNEMLSNIVIEVQIKVMIEPEEFRGGTEGTVAENSQVKLPCHYTLGSCNTPLSRYVWNVPTDRCPLADVRLIYANEASISPDQAVVVSVDGSLVRLIKQDRVSMCDRSVFRTNYDDLFLYEITGGLKVTPFKRKIRTKEISTVTYVKNRDDYLFHYIKDGLNEEFKHVLRKDCESRREQNQLAFWLRHQDPGFHTWSLGNGTFATVAGEVIYQYKCRGLVVRARETAGQCFQALPVKVQDEKDPLNQRLLQEDLFLEPLTHRLTPSGILVPCSNQFVAKYQNLKGTWTAAGPSLLETTAPYFPPPNIDAHQQFFPNAPSFEIGGVYYDPDIRNAERLQNYGREKEALASDFIYQMEGQKPAKGFISPEHFFPQLTTSPLEHFKAKLFKFLHNFGEGAAIFLACYIIGRFILAIITSIISCMVIKKTHGCNNRIWYSLCPDILLLRSYRKLQTTPDDLREMELHLNHLQAQLNEHDQRLRQHQTRSVFPLLPMRDLTEDPLLKLKEKEAAIVKEPVSEPLIVQEHRDLYHSHSAPSTPRAYARGRRALSSTSLGGVSYTSVRSDEAPKRSMDLEADDAAPPANKEVKFTD
jgi:hypothetical protein